MGMMLSALSQEEQRFRRWVQRRVGTDRVLPELEILRFKFSNPMVCVVQVFLQQFHEPIDEPMICSKATNQLVASSNSSVSLSSDPTIFLGQHFQAFCERPNYSVSQFCEQRIDYRVGYWNLINRIIAACILDQCNCVIVMSRLIFLSHQCQNVRQSHKFAPPSSRSGQLAVRDPNSERPW